MIFALHKEILVKMGAYSDKKGHISKMFAIFLSLFFIFFIISSSIFIFKYILINLEATLFGILQVSAVTGALYSLIVLVYNRKRVFDIEELIQKMQGNFHTFVIV